MKTFLYRRRSILFDRGFSFIELLAYMAIAALLILAAIPQFNQYRAKAVVSNLQNDVHNASLAAEASQIGTVSKNLAEDGPGIHLAAATTNIDIASIQTAVSKVQRSSTTDKDFSVTALGGNGYQITASSSKTDIKAIYSSDADATNSYPVGIVTVDKTGAMLGTVAVAAPTPTATANPNFYCSVTNKQIWLKVKNSAVPATFPYGLAPTYNPPITAIEVHAGGQIIDTNPSSWSTDWGPDTVGLIYNYTPRYTDAQVAAFQKDGYVIATIGGKSNRLDCVN